MVYCSYEMENTSSTLRLFGGVLVFLVSFSFKKYCALEYRIIGGWNKWGKGLETSRKFNKWGGAGN